ncbi:uncharacterized protein [Antedon mediterranea]|uniref:uncharacterized protein n=1 Tax=Antedon mediterranea TaxID=105859 RepID=UPI003AF460CC
MGPVPKEDRSDPGRNDDESLMEPGFVVMENDATDSEDEESGDEGDHQGYQLLSQEPEGDHQGCQLLSQEPDLIINDDCSLGATASAQTSRQPEISAQLAHCLPKEMPKPDTSTIVTHTDSPETLKQRRELMANDDLIKAAMSGIKLPTTGVPNWANFVQEKDWKKNIVKTARKERLNDEENKSGENS